MTKKTLQELLTTTSGKILPDMCFRSAHSAKLDKQAVAMLHARYQKIFMYEGNLSFPQKSYTLFDHVMGLMDMTLDQGLIQDVIDNPQEAPPEHVAFVSKTLQGILMHDAGEGTAGEPMTALFKWSHPHLVPHAKQLEATTAAPLYGYALSSNLCKNTVTFRKQIKSIEKKFQRHREYLQDNIFTDTAYDEAIFADAVQTAINSVQTSYVSSLELLTPEEKALVGAMTEAYALQYEAIENPESPRHGTAEKFIKLIDKSCLSYNHHAHASYKMEKPTTPLHERLSNSTTLNDLIRSEKPIMAYASIQQDEVANHFAPAAYEIGFHRLSDYALTMRPVLFGENNAPKEPDYKASKEEWYKSGYLPQRRLLQQNRKNGIHFMEDSVKSNLEVYALLMAKWVCNEHLTRSIFDTALTYSPKCVEIAENTLTQVQQSNLAPRHFNNYPENYTL